MSPILCEWWAWCVVFNHDVLPRTRRAPFLVKAQEGGVHWPHRHHHVRRARRQRRQVLPRPDIAHRHRLLAVPHHTGRRRELGDRQGERVRLPVGVDHQERHALRCRSTRNLSLSEAYLGIAWWRDHVFYALPLSGFAHAWRVDWNPPAAITRSLLFSENRPWDDTCCGEGGGVSS